MRRGIHSIFLRALIVLAALAAVAVAQPSADESAEARFKAGKQAYRLGDFDEAIAAWKEAYRLKDNPAFLFNIAQAYREKGDLPKAVMFFENYLKEAKSAPNRAEVEKRVAELKKLIEDQKASAQRPPTGPVDPATPNKTEPTGTAPEPTEPEPTATEPEPTATPIAEPRASGSSRPGRGLRLAGIGSAGIGVALVTTGVVYGLKANTARKDVERAVQGGEVWTPELDHEDARGRRAATISNVSIGVGAAAVVTGGVLFYLGRRAGLAERPSDVALVPSVTTDGFSVSLDGRF